MTVNAAPPSRRRSAARESLLSRGGAMLVMAICTFYFLVPIWWLVVAASKSREQFTTTTPLWFADFNLFVNIGNLIAYENGVFLRWMLNSILYAGAGAAIATLLATMAGRSSVGDTTAAPIGARIEERARTVHAAATVDVDVDPALVVRVDPAWLAEIVAALVHNAAASFRRRRSRCRSSCSSARSARRTRSGRCSCRAS